MRERFTTILTPQMRPLLVPLLLLVAVVISFVGVFYVVNQVGKNRDEVRQLNVEVQTLATKKETLRSVDKEKAENQAHILAQAIPEQSGVLAVISRVKDVISDTSLRLLRVNVAVRPGEKTIVGELKVDLEGSLPNIESFAENIEKSLPFVKIGNGRLSESGGVSHALVELSTYSKSIPTQLPDITVPIQTLSSSEGQILQKVQEYQGTRVVFSPSSSQPDTGRPNPFSF